MRRRGEEESKLVCRRLCQEIAAMNLIRIVNELAQETTILVLL